MVDPIVNPRAQQGQIMGPQSQRRLTLQARTHRLQAAASTSFGRKRRGGQQTLQGDRAFNPTLDCEVCKARLSGRSPHRPHHPLCWNNKRSKGIVSVSTLLQRKEDKRLKEHFLAPLKATEKASGRHTTKEACDAFFAARLTTKKQSTARLNNISEKAMEATTTVSTPVAANEFCTVVTDKLQDPSFCQEHAKARAPLAMLAFAGAVVDRIIRTKKTSEHFDGLTMCVPACEEMYQSPHYHSIVGQKLLLVDWEKMFGLKLDCPEINCDGRLCGDRTNFSKNKLLFPIYEVTGVPSWAMVMSMKCSCCNRRYNANDGQILAGIPAHIVSAYPVEHRFALANRNCHVGRTSTANVIDLLMTTYANGDLCSRLLYNAMNRAYLERVADYYSFNRNKECPKYIDKDGQFITAYPPLGDLIRDIHDNAMSNDNNPWKLSDHDRHSREIQGVGSRLLYAEDHTHQVTRNYFRRQQIGANALWDMATETSEIATAVLVPSTKTKDLSHAAAQVARRPHFNPAAMYSDRWPTKSGFWNLLYGPKLEGRLGLFHYLQRMIKTLRKTHCDYFRAVNLLLDSVYFYFEKDYEKLLVALKEGTLSSTGKKYTDEDIAELKRTKLFRQRYAKHLRKVIRPPNIINERLENWFVRFKCSASPGAALPLGRLDPITKEPLFTAATKDAVMNCKDKSKYLQDPLPFEDMYDEILPNPNSPHGLSEFLSRRGESNLEAFHLMLAHFANTGMRETLADNLNLAGTARYNLAIRHKLKIARLSTNTERYAARAKIPAAWETVVPFSNHTELAYINSLATEAGHSNAVPFPNAEPLLEDNGERFFSEYLTWLKETKPKQDENDMCLCLVCQPSSTASPPPIPQQKKPPPTIYNNNNHIAPPSNVPALGTAIVRAAQRPPPVPPMPPPFPWINPYLLPPAGWGFCCLPYRSYSLREDRRGCPPHDRRCPNRRKKSSSAIV